MLRTVTLIFALSLILAALVDARSDPPFARRHAPAANRMIRKRASPADIVNAAALSPPSSSPATNSDTASSTDTSPSPLHLTPASPTPTVASPSAVSSQASTSQSNSVFSISLLSSIVVVGPTPSNVSSSTSASSTLASSSSSSSPPSLISTPSSTQSSTQSSTDAAVSQTVLSSIDPVTITSSAMPSGSTAAATSSGSVTKLQRNTIIILIAIGASIGAAGIIWTIIRKWKFSPSRSSDDRLQPIDWQPTTGPLEDRDMTEKLARNGSTRSHGSFTSGNHHDNLTSDLPQHDFTAGPAYLAPGGGYADLQRGASPQPDLQHGQNFQAPPGDYHYEIPNPHGQYYNGAGVGAGTSGYQGGFDYNRGY